MDNLIFELRKMCERNRDGSHSTRANRLRILTQIANELREMGYRHLYPTSLKGKHVDALLNSWQAKNLSAGTMKNRLCALRWWTEKVGTVEASLKSRLVAVSRIRPGMTPVYGALRGGATDQENGC